jgi:hypothetical protein
MEWAPGAGQSSKQYVKKIEKSLTAIMSQGNREGEFRVEEPDLAAILVHSACLRFCHPSLSIECPRELDLGVAAAARGRPVFWAVFRLGG